MTDGFDFDKGDKVCVRVREHGTSGKILVKFTAACARIEGSVTGLKARFDLPGTMNSVTYGPHEAEFEVVDDE